MDKRDKRDDDGQASGHAEALQVHDQHPHHAEEGGQHRDPPLHLQ